MKDKKNEKAYKNNTQKHWLTSVQKRQGWKGVLENYVKDPCPICEGLGSR